MSTRTAIHYEEIDQKVESLMPDTLQVLLDLHTRDITKSKWPRDDRKNSLSHKSRCLLLYQDAFWPKECGCHLPTTGR
ncbi:hypothetical protein Tco_1446178 [Tanacetum coccineum]